MTHPTGTRERAAVAAAFAAFVIVTTAPYIAAWRDPPAGSRFVGVFFYRDDFYQYTSFAEQAQRGAWVFRNKFDTRPHEPFVINLEWWAAGVFGRALGGPVAGFHALRLVALLGLVTGAASLLRAGGLSGARRAWALALFLAGGGLGWLLLWTGTPGWQVPDIAMGFYPFHQGLTNAHFVVGTALLVWAVVLLLDERAGRRGRAPWLAVAWLLGLCRPYDLVTLSLVAGACCLFDVARPSTRGAGVRRLLDLLWLSPVFTYYVLLATGHPSFRSWGGQGIDVTPPSFQYALAILPAALLWIAWSVRGTEAPADGVRRAVAAWVLAIALIIAVAPGALARQTITGLGAAVLLAAGLQIPRRWLPWSTLAAAPTSAFLVWRLFHPSPDAFAPEGYFQVAGALAASCADGDVAVAPTDLSLMIAGLTPCSVVFGHRTLTPEYARRSAEGNHFYHDPATAPAWRLQYLDAHRARFVLLPPGGRRLLPPGAPFAPRLRTSQVEVWEKAR